MKRAIFYFILAIFIAIVIQPNLQPHEKLDHVRVPDVSTSTPKTNEEAGQRNCKSKAKIGIDAANGGEDFGYIGNNTIAEKDINLQIALTIGNKLEAHGYNVVYTRQNDTIDTYDTEAISDAERLEKMKSKRVDYLIRVDMSNSSDTLKKGFAIFTQSNPEMQKLSEAIAKELNHINFSTCEGVDSDHYANFTILNDKEVPSVLLELGYLSNKEDFAKLTDTSVQEKIGQAVVNAFLNEIN